MLEKILYLFQNCFFIPVRQAAPYHFAILKAEQNVERRLAAQVGDRIMLNLAVHFERNLEPPGEGGTIR